MMGIFSLPFFKNKTASFWRHKVAGKNFFLKPMRNISYGFKTSSPEKWRRWALSSLDMKSSPVDAQLIYKEWHSLNLGKNQSPSLDEYYALEKESFQVKNKNEFYLALQYGLDLVLPKAYAEDASAEDLENAVLETQSLTESQQEDLEAEEHISAEINNVGKYGPTKMMKFMGLGAAAAGLALGMVSKTGGAMDSLIAKPMNRGLLMQATAILAFSTSSQVAKDLEKIEKNRKVVRGILTKFKGKSAATEVEVSADTLSTQSSEVAGTSQLSISAQSIIQKDASLGQEFLRDSLAIPCPGGYNGEGDCQESEGLTLEVEKIASESGLGNLLAGFVQPLDTINNLSKETLNGNVEKASALFSEIGTKKLGAISKTLKEVQDKVNQTRVDRGKAPIDFKSKAESIGGQLQNLVRGEASYAPGGLAAFKPISGSVDTITADSQGKISVAKQVNRGFLPPKNFKKRKGSSSGGSGVMFGSFSSRKPASQTKSAKELSKYKEKFSDINQSESVNIFKIISSRYTKTALPSFFKRKK